jgi:hypothetical protein
MGQRSPSIDCFRQLNPAYFEYLDQLTATLVERAIVPVLQPVFMGFGWNA